MSILKYLLLTIVVKWPFITEVEVRSLSHVKWSFKLLALNIDNFFHHVLTVIE